ncbi:MAG TPA: DUF126 domain-containing protein, partial [Actinomycetota bacterium]
MVRAGEPRVRHGVRHHRGVPAIGRRGPRRPRRAALGRGVRARGRALVAGEAEGPVLALDEPLSFWGGLDAATGKVVDPHHPQRGRAAAGAVLV